MLRAVLATAATACFLALACSGDDPPAGPTATLFPELEDTPGATVVPPPLTTPGPAAQVPGTVWLIEVASGTVITLDVDLENPPALAWFDNASDTVVYHPVEDGKSISIRVDLNGREVERADIIHSPLSEPPQSRWQLDRVGTGEAVEDGATYGLSDMWVVDTETGERTLLATGLRQCAACDASSSPSWSPSGRYIFYREHGGENRVFLSDLQLGMTRNITVDRLERVPQWSPKSDVLIRPSPGGSTVLEDLEASTEKDLGDVPWPASFDPSGEYIYSSATGSETVIVDAASGDVVAVLEGSATFDALLREDRPLPQLYPGVPRTVVATKQGFAAAVSGGGDCAGTLLFASDRKVGCFEASGNPVFSADGSQVILARETAKLGPVEASYDIIAVDTTTGEERILVTEAQGSRNAPHVVWNAAGTHILVRWPFSGFGP